MIPEDHTVILDEQGWQAVAFLLGIGEISVSEFVDIAIEQVSA